MKEKNATSAFIKEIIRERGLKIKDVAEKIGYSHTMLSYMLADQRSIKDTDVLKISQVLGVTPNELFGIGSDAKMPIEITVRAEPEKISRFINEVRDRQYSQVGGKISETAFKVICKFVKDFGIDDAEINTLIDELKEELSEKDLF